MDKKIIIALDTHDPALGERLLNELSSFPVWFKVGMEAYHGLGPQFIFEIKEKGHQVFLDLKLHDIPNTVRKGIEALSHLPIDMLNVHCLGGREMLLRAKEAVKSFKTPPLLIGVTQLTSSTTLMMNSEQGIPGNITDNVLLLASLAKESGLDGIVSSPHEVKKIKEVCGESFLTVTPGIRPLNEEVHDQKRITTPQEAFSLGTDFIVIGRPVTEASSPKDALAKILKELQ